MPVHDIYVIIAQAVVVGAFMAFIAVFSNRSWRYLNKRDDELRRFIENQRGVDRRALQDVVVKVEELARIIMECERKNDAILAELFKEKGIEEK